MSAPAIWGPEAYPVPSRVPTQLPAQQPGVATGGFERDHFAPRTADTQWSLAAWLQQSMARWRAGTKARTRERQLELVEALSLGGKRQLLLVRCGGESFLVGGNATDVQTMVRVSERSGG
jgi:hypothetical protein